MANPETLPASMQVPFTATALDAKGNPSPVTNFAVAVDNPALATVSPLTTSADGTSVAGVLTPVGPLGTVTLTATATASDGSTVTGTQAVTIVADVATQIAFTFGTPAAPTA